MKKFLLSTVTIVGFLAYSFYKKSEANANSNVIFSMPIHDNTVQNLPAVTPGQGMGNSQMAGQMGGSMMGSYKDGVYTGNTTDAYYGYVQVQATVSNGKIADVAFLNYPQDRRTSVYINSQAMPLLKQEAITAQSAQVNIVSGATQTSLAFRQSLQSALDKAQ